MNKLSLVGMQLPEKYKENFDISSEGPSDEGPSDEGLPLCAQNSALQHKHFKTDWGLYRMVN
jgi:hypothetical protein